MAKYSARKKQHGEEPDDDVEIPARAVNRKSKQNNVSDILADSVQIKRKESELRQRELKLREEEQRKQQLFQEYLLTQQKEAQQKQHTMNLAIMNALGELLQKIKITWARLFNVKTCLNMFNFNKLFIYICHLLKLNSCIKLKNCSFNILWTMIIQ